MRIDSITTYITFLDSEYRNVYDDYGSYKEYKDFLDANFQNTKITLQDTKSVKTLNGNLVITVSGIADDFLFNYVCIEYINNYLTRDYKFYFVDKIESLNDGFYHEGNYNPSCKLYLKYDSWTNTYRKTEYSIHPQYLVRSTQTNILDYGNKYKIPANYGINNFKHTSTKLSDYPIVGGGMLCIGFRCAKEKVKEFNSDWSSGVEGNGCVFSQNSSPVYYYPLKSLLSENGIFRTLDGYEYTNLQKGFSTILPSFINSSAVLNAWVTVNAVYTNNETSTLHCNSVNLEIETPTEKYRFRALMPFEYHVTATVDINPAIPYSNENAKGYTELQESEELLNVYPFNSNSIIVNGKLVEVPNDISTEDRQLAVIDILRKNSTTPYVKISYNGNTSLYKKINVNFPIVKYVDSLDLFLQNNQSGYTASIASSLAQTALGGVEAYYGGIDKGIGKIFSGTNGIISSIAKYKDNDRALDSYDIPPDIGSDSFYYDSVLVVKTEINDEKTRKNAFYDFHNKGCYFNNYDILIHKHHVLFDYTQTLDCSIPVTYDKIHIKEIEDAFNRGITRFHITNSNIDALVYLETEYSNEPIY